MDGTLYLSPGLVATLPDHINGGSGICPQHQELHDKGYVAFVEIDGSKTGVNFDNKDASEREVLRTGRMIHIRRTVAAKVLRNGAAKDASRTARVLYVDIGAIDQLVAFINGSIAEGSLSADDAPI